MKLRLLNDVSILKSTDNATAVELSITDNQDEVLMLDMFTSISVAIGYNGARYSTEIPVISDDKQSMSFTISNLLPASVYNIEVNLINLEGGNHIAPSEGKFNLTIEKSMNELGESITVISVQQLLDDMADVKRIASQFASTVEENNALVTESLTIVTNVLHEVSNTTLLADNANTVAIASSVESKIASGLANEAKVIATESKVIAEGSSTVSKGADVKATQALEIANQSDIKSTNAENVANAVRSEFDSIVEGNTSVEVIQARGGFGSIKERLDDTDNRILNAGKIKTVNGVDPDTNGNIAITIPEVDFTPYETIENADVKLSGKVDKVTGKGLSTNDYTTTEKDKLGGIETGANNYTLPTATTSVIGGIKVGTNLSVSSGTVSVANASTSANGVVQLSTSVSSTSTTTAATSSAVKTVSDNIGTLPSLVTTNKTSVVNAVNELFTSVSNGKNAIASAITSKGGSASGGDTFADLSSKISGLGGGVKSIQRGLLSGAMGNTNAIMTKDVTINTVNSNNTLVIINTYADSDFTINRVTKIVELMSNTTLRITAGPNAKTMDTWQVVEFDKLKSKQSGTLTMSTSESRTSVVISGVNVSKSLLVFSFFNNSDADTRYLYSPRAYLNSTSEIIFERYTATSDAKGTITVAWQLAEFD